MSPARRSPEDIEQQRAALVEHAQRIVTRDGAAALTMRRLAAEAGCAVGLPYKLFVDRNDLIIEVLHGQFGRLASNAAELVGRAGTRTVAANLAHFATRFLDSTAVALVSEVHADPALAARFTERFGGGARPGPAGLEAAFAAYLAAEQRAGRVAPDVDTAAFGFLLAGAIHNLAVSGAAYPRPSRTKLRRLLAATAATIAPDHGA